ncbi:unnamed protein product [Peronospora farinosa]|uniref:RRM domain-containing protein n=1 Tax=Peronospora farinosa TaxID=134698 RepID=A0AAV0T1T5_9STRA|nr:unnamed protein product [Peronospora farinosa]CAI5712938.1 unnamed protein product [Peronospora farinosa]
MDLYADLPLAKGAKTSSALDADGKPKTSLSSTNSVWASAPLMVPQAAKNKNNNMKSRPTAVVASSTSMSFNVLAAGRGKSVTRSTMSLAFKPSSVTRRTSTGATTQVVSKKEGKVQATGLGYVAPMEVKVALVQQQEKEVDVDVGAVGGHFFQATYRDEYQPARPNSYEVFCKERKEKKKLEQVKRALSRRQKEQEREGKLEREKLAKDLAEGRAPNMKLPAPAGRGRGMTMPAWMRKKIEENAASQPESERDVDREHEPGEVAKFIEEQFEDAAEPRGGLGFSADDIGFSSSFGSSSSAVPDEIARAAAGEPNLQLRVSSLRGGDRDSKHRHSTLNHHSNAPMMDEFGREVRHKVQHGSEDQSTEIHDEGRTSIRSYNSHGSGSESRAPDEKRRRTSGWDSRSPHKTSLTSRVVLLQNMVGPGEVDEELQDEVKGECSETYGPVAKCVIYEATERVPPEEAVRIFVQFTNLGDATKALTGLHGRFFGGRKVKAVYYDESKFERMDLKSQ